MIPIPKPEDYDVSCINGFMPTEPPLERLPDSYYAPWEFVIKNLQGLILTGRIREVIDRMPILNTDRLINESQWRRANSTLAFMVHAYIWGGDTPAERIPPPLSVPFVATCKKLELPLVASYAGLVLWNWKPVFESEPIDTLANLDIIDTFTGSLDEKWFYLISAAIEARGGPIVPLMLQAIQAAAYGNRGIVTECLKSFAERLDELTDMLGRMYDHCDPHVFYHRLRPYLAGSKGMEQAGLPNGVIFDNGGPMHKQRYVQYSGGSNAQSSLIQFFDIVLGVEHLPTGQRPGGAPKSLADRMKPTPSFIHDQRKYMPGRHCRFLERVEEVANIRQFVHANEYDTDLKLAFDACLAMLSKFRDTHIQIVSRYIIIKSREVAKQQQQQQEEEETAGDKKKTSPSAAAAPLPKKEKINLATRPKGDAPGKEDLKGTGGSSLIPFLRQARDEIGSSAVDAWTRRLLIKDRQSLQHDEHLEISRKVRGLAGVWEDTESWGGLCQV